MNLQKFNPVVVAAEVDGEDRYYVTITPAEVVNECGLKWWNIVGSLNQFSDGVREGNFIPNEKFLVVLTDFFASMITDDVEVGVTSGDIKREWQYIIDQRVEDTSGAVPPEEIVGAYEIYEGRKVGFQLNPNYKLVSARGFFDFGAEFNLKLIDFMSSYSE